MHTRPAAAQAASVTVFVPGLLRKYSAGEANLTVDAATVRDALGQIRGRFPSLYGSVCDETGAVRRHVNLFVNADHIRDLDGLGSALTPGDVLTILPAVSGG